MISHMNGRQFKKLCKKAHALVVQIEPNWASSTYCAPNGEAHDNWHHTVLKGTKGFGGVTGYYEPEWSDRSAWDWLLDAVLWHFCDQSNPLEAAHMYPDWLPGMKPRRWQDVIALGERMLAEKLTGKGE